jgi:hypothetical protein
VTEVAHLSGAESIGAVDPKIQKDFLNWINENPSEIKNDAGGTG